MGRNEYIGTYSLADILLGIEGVNLGIAIDKYLWGRYYLDPGNIGDWMQSRLGE